MKKIEDLLVREPKEISLSWEGRTFRLREIENAIELAHLFRKIRLYSQGVKDFQLPNGEKVDLPADLAIACLWVSACLVEPQLSFEELVQVSLHTGGLVFRLFEKSLQICGMLDEEEEDFFPTNGKRFGRE